MSRAGEGEIGPALVNQENISWTRLKTFRRPAAGPNNGRRQALFAFSSGTHEAFLTEQSTLADNCGDG
jgi:hypothetical protein